MNKKLVSMAYSNYYRKELFTLEEAIEFLWKDNVINVGELAERAIIRNSKNLTKNSRGQKGSDFSDKSDSKYVTVHYGSSAYAAIAGIKNKIGMLRVMVHEPKTNKNYFFRIPYKVYAPYVGKNDSIKVYFNKHTGAPRRPTRENIRYDLWDYKCSAEEWAK